MQRLINFQSVATIKKNGTSRLSGMDQLSNEQIFNGKDNPISMSRYK